MMFYNVNRLSKLKIIKSEKNEWSGLKKNVVIIR